MEFNKKTIKALVIAGIVGCLALACVIRLYNLQIVNGEDYRAVADGSSS